MSISKGLAVALVFAVSVLSSAGYGSAWSNGGYSADLDNPDYGTHDWIAEEALELQVRDVTFLRDGYHSEYLLGTEAPDNPEFIGDNLNHHVYFYASGELQDDACAIRASQIYDTALQYLLDEEYANAAYDIGVMVHYISDPGVFGHTMGAYTDWGTEEHHSDYEGEFESRLTSLPSPTGITLGDSTAYSAALELGRAVTFGEGDVKPNTWMDDNYSWTNDIFVSSAYASLHASVAAVASAVNHLLTEAAAIPPPDPYDPEPDIPDLDVPEPPRAFTALVSESKVVLSWTPPLDDGGSVVIAYVIYRGTEPDSLHFLASVSAESNGYDDSSVEAGVTYFYSITAVNAVGNSPPTQVVSVSLPDDDGLPGLFLVASASSIGVVAGGVTFWLWRRRSARL